MIRHTWAIGAVALGFTLAASGASAGQRPGGAGGGPVAESRPRGGGSGGGDGVASGGGSGGSVSTGSSSSSSGSTSAGGGFAPAPSRPQAASERAPQRPRGQGAAVSRPRGGDGGSGRAVPRGSTPSGEPTTTSSPARGERDRVATPRDRAVPVYSRPRDGRPVTGHATGRRTPIPDRNGRDGYYYYSPYPYGYYNDPYGSYGSYWYPGYSLGMGYFYYDPFWFGSYASRGGYGAYQGYGGYQGYGSGSYSYHEAGALRLKIKPRDAQVFVDGYFVGDVDSFDGVFQRLKIEAGAHKIEIRAPGYEPLEIDVLLAPGETITYKGDLQRVQ